MESWQSVKGNREPLFVMNEAQIAYARNYDCTQTCLMWTRATVLLPDIPLT